MEEYVEVEKLKEDIASNILEDLRKEKTLLTEDFPLCALLIGEAFERFESTGHLPGDENYMDIINQKPIKIAQKVLVPYKILTRNRSFLMSLQDEAQCKIVIKDGNSSSDHVKEEELQSNELQFNHLTKVLFLEISTLSTPIECYSRITYALTEIQKYLMFDKDDVSSEELLEIEIVPEILSYPDSLKQERLDQILPEDPLLDLGCKETVLSAPVLNKSKGSKKEETSMMYKSIGILNNFVASKSLSKLMQTSVDANMEIQNLNSLKLTNKTCSQRTDQHLGAPKTFAAKRKNMQDLTNANNIIFKKEKQLYNKRRKKKLQIKKDKYPGIFYIKDKKSSKITKHRILNKSALYRCLRRCKTELTEPQENENFKLFTIDFVQQSPFELVFENTPRDVILSFLDDMKNYPVLWEFHDKPFNEDYKKAIENLREMVNTKWSLNVDSLQLRRSITRILRFYRYLFPFECIEKFTDYFEKCAAFLPSTVINIPHARCSHCFICYKEDFELKKHLLEEQKSLKWRYKCQFCAESFREIDEFEFHNRLPHYVEVFTCEHCNRRFNNRCAYSRHLGSHQQKTNEVSKNYICDECGKDFKTRGELRGHKSYHGEKKIKCHLCSKSYFRNTSLILHLKSHRKELDFICEVCGCGFISQAYLKNHMEKHIGLQVSCTICGLKLRKHNLFRHLRTVHVACEGTIEETFRAKGHNYKRTNQVYKATFNPCPNRSERAKEIHQRQYECKICNIPFDRLKFLKDHNKKCHLNVHKLPCKICESQLSHKQNLKRHYREKHKLHEYQVYAIIEKQEDINTVLKMKSEFLQKTSDKTAMQSV